MIVALFALAVLMIVGGIASVVQGFPFVRLESGLAMVIAGATTASAGAVLLGVTHVALRLRGVERALAASPREGVRDDLLSSEPEPALDGLAASPDLPTRDLQTPDLPISESPTKQRPILAAGTARDGGLATASSRRGSEPTFAEPAPMPVAAEPLLPDLLPDTPTAADEAVHRRGAVADAIADSAPQPARPGRAPEAAAGGEGIPPHPVEPTSVSPDADLPFGLRSSFAETSDPEAAGTVPGIVEEWAPADVAPRPEALEVVGTYASGGNSYVMFSNGSIEAETPRGRYNFSSLDELKAFVEAGGEADRGAA